MRKLLLFLLLLGAATRAQAQVFRPGQLVLAKGDTLRGEIEDNAWDESPPELRLRADDGQVTTYPAAAIQSFRLEAGQYFRRETVPLDRAARTRTDDLVEGLHPHQLPESLLLEVVVDGPGQLFYTSVADVPHYFVRRPNQPFTELAARRYLRRTTDGVLAIADGNNYRVQLQQVFGDCPNAGQLLPRTAFTMRDLAAVVQAYNQQCSPIQEVAPEYLSRPLGSRVAFNLSVVAGARYGSSRLGTDEPTGLEAPVLQGVNLDGVLHPVGGLTLELLTPGRRLGVQLSTLLASTGRNGAVPEAAPGYAGTLYGRALLLETRLGGRAYWPLGGAGTRLLVGAGITVPSYLSSFSTLRLQYGPTANAYRQVAAPPATTAPAYAATTDGVPSSYPHSRFTGAFYSSLPYLEAGVRQGHLTVLLDGRLALPDTYNTLVSLQAAGPAGYSYSYTAWYLGVSVGYALLYRQ